MDLCSQAVGLQSHSVRVMHQFGSSKWGYWEVLNWFDSEAAVWASGVAETVDYSR